MKVFEGWAEGVSEQTPRSLGGHRRSFRNIGRIQEQGECGKRKTGPSRALERIPAKKTEKSATINQKGAKQVGRPGLRRGGKTPEKGGRKGVTEGSCVWGEPHSKGGVGKGRDDSREYRKSGEAKRKRARPGGGAKYRS